MHVTQHHPESPQRLARPAPFEAAVSHGGHGATVRVSGEIDAASAPALGDVLVAAGSDREVVHLDLGATTFIDSAGIRILVRSMWSLREAGSGLLLVAASTMAENILRITGILDVLKDPAP